MAVPRREVALRRPRPIRPARGAAASTTSRTAPSPARRLRHVAPRPPSPRARRWPPRSGRPTRCSTGTSARSSPTNATSSQPRPCSLEQRRPAAAPSAPPGPGGRRRSGARGRGARVASDTPAADDRHRGCRSPSQQRQPEPVLDVEPLELDPLPPPAAPMYTPLSVRTPSTSSASEADAAAPRAGQAPARLAGAVPRGRASGRISVVELVERPLVAASLGARAGIGMRLEEEPVRARRRGGGEQRRDELAAGRRSRRPRPARAAGRSAWRRRSTGTPVAAAHPREAPHVHDEVAVAEEGAPLGDGHLAATPAPLHLLHRARHPLGLHPLPLLHVHRLAGRARRPRAGRSAGRGTRGSAARPPPRRPRAACAASWMSVRIGQARSRPAPARAPRRPSSSPGPRVARQPRAIGLVEAGLEADRHARRRADERGQRLRRRAGMSVVLFDHAGPGDQERRLGRRSRRISAERLGQVDAAPWPAPPRPGAARSAAPMNPAKSGCGRVGRDLQLGMELAADEPRMVGQLDHLDQPAVGRLAARAAARARRARRGRRC